MITTRPRPRSRPTTPSCQSAQANLAALEATAVDPGQRPTPGCRRSGDLISEDQPVYSLSNQSVPLLYGSVAAYRAFYVGMSDGADVGQLTHDLIALGYGAGLTQSNHYSAATAAAVERWQTALGLPATGDDPAGPGGLRAGPDPGHLGHARRSAPSAGGGGSGGGGGGTVLTATSTTPVVTVALEVTQEYLVKPGDAVTVVLPDGTTTVGGRVETVGNVATCPGGSGSGTGTGGSADQSPCSSSGGSDNSTPDGHGHRQPWTHPARGHPGPGPGERRHHHRSGPTTCWPCRSTPCWPLRAAGSASRS